MSSFTIFTECCRVPNSADFRNFKVNFAAKPDIYSIQKVTPELWRQIDNFIQGDEYQKKLFWFPKVNEGIVVLLNRRFTLLYEVGPVNVPTKPHDNFGAAVIVLQDNEAKSIPFYQMAIIELASSINRGKEKRKLEATIALMDKFIANSYQLPQCILGNIGSHGNPAAAEGFVGKSTNDLSKSTKSKFFYMRPIPGLKIKVTELGSCYSIRLDPAEIKSFAVRTFETTTSSTSSSFSRAVTLPPGVAVSPIQSTSEPISRVLVPVSYPIHSFVKVPAPTFNLATIVTPAQVVGQAIIETRQSLMPSVTSSSANLESKQPIPLSDASTSSTTNVLQVKPSEDIEALLMAQINANGNDDHLFSVSWLRRIGRSAVDKTTGVVLRFLRART